jgi:4-hydroxy-tetrahydrodipicolinate synthase
MNTSSPRVTRSAFQGVFAAVVTPMNANEEIDFPRLTVFINYLLGKGVHGLIPLGSTGEYYALSADERDRVLRSTLEVVAGRVPVVAGANAGSTRDVIAYARKAEQLGCAGVMLAPPYYSLPQPEELYAHFRAVNDSIGIPIMLYNYPGRTGVDMPPEFIERLAGFKNVRYVKESTGEMARITELLRRCGNRLGVFCGCDTIALESLMVGAIGWIGGVVNVLPKSHISLYELTVVKKDYAAARRLFFRMLPTLELMEGGGKYTQFVKAACGLVGHPVGSPRRPLMLPTAAERALLQKALSETGEV